jgi:Fe-S cluster assembly protein SufD
MQEIIQAELFKNSEAVLKKAVHLSPSYQAAMKNAHQNFKTLGIPSKKSEDWKYTNIAKNLSPRFYEQKVSLNQDVPQLIIDKRGMIIFNNGIFNQFLSVLPEGCEIESPELTSDFYDSFDSLNFAVAISPLTLKIQKNTTLDFPMTIVHLIDETAVNKMVSPRLTIKVGDHSRVSFLEYFTSSNNSTLQYTTNAVTHFFLNQNSKVEHVKIQSEAQSAIHIGLTKANVARDANFQSITLDFGILTSRHNLNIDLNDSGAITSAHGLFVLKKLDHADIFSTISHKFPNTTSDQLFKGILGGESHGVFTGKILILKDAQKSASSQLNKNLILSKKAHIDTRPQLLVHADDVKCSHGATVGQLSKEEEFYLESRGISAERAKKMLCLGFAMDVLQKIENSSIKLLAEKLLLENFQGNDFEI